MRELLVKTTYLLKGAKGISLIEVKYILRKVRAQLGVQPRGFILPLKMRRVEQDQYR